MMVWAQVLGWNILGFSPRIVWKPKRHQVSDISVPCWKGNWPSQQDGYSNYYSTFVVSRKVSQKAQHVKPGGWATTAEDHTGFHSCQPRSGGTGSLKLDQASDILALKQIFLYTSCCIKIWVIINYTALVCMHVLCDWCLNTSIRGEKNPDIQC